MNSPVRSMRDIVYRSVDGNDLKLDLHLPACPEGPVPVVAYFHGGGFEVGDRSDYEATRALPLASSGVAVATVSYRLKTVAAFPAPLEDARAAVSWLRSHGADYGLATDSIGVMGASAGGYLAAMLGLGSWDGSVNVTAVVAWFAPLDLDQTINGSPLERELFPTELLDGRYDAGRPAHVALNPMANAAKATAGFLLITGDRDRVVDAGVSERFHTALTLVHIPSTLVLVGGAGHEDPRIDGPEYAGLIQAFFKARLVHDRKASN